jgi:hypothetical protein
VWRVQRSASGRSTSTGDLRQLVEPFVTTLRKNATATGIGDPLATFAAEGHHHFLTMSPGATAPGATAPGTAGHGLVVPYRKGKAKTTAEPMHTVATRDSAALVRPAIAVADCYFRMLEPREHLRAQRFLDTYTVTGNRSEQTMQAGNAVSAKVAKWLGLTAALNGTSTSWKDVTSTVDATVSAIDDVIGDTASTATPDRGCCQCGNPLADSPSDDFCTEPCQAEWLSHQRVEAPPVDGGTRPDRARGRPGATHDVPAALAGWCRRARRGDRLRHPV